MLHGSFCVQRVDRMKASRLIENTISAGRRIVVSRKWYREGYLLKDGRELPQIQFMEAGDSLCAAVYIELAIDMLKMHLDRTSGKKQFLSDVQVGETIGDQTQHFEFAAGELINQT